MGTFSPIQARAEQEILCGQLQCMCCSVRRGLGMWVCPTIHIDGSLSIVSGKALTIPDITRLYELRMFGGIQREPELSIWKKQ